MSDQSSIVLRTQQLALTDSSDTDFIEPSILESWEIFCNPELRVFIDVDDQLDLHVRLNNSRKHTSESVYIDPKVLKQILSVIDN